jgi:transposase
LEDGAATAELDDAAQKKAAKYLVVRIRGKNVHISFNEKACAEACKYHGYFAIVSNSEKDTFAALLKYRKREYIEDYFRAAKQNADSTRVRVWDSDTLRGRMFVQFISLCYYEYLSEAVRKLKLTLATDTELPSPQLKLEKKLKSWLENTPIYLQLQWFDAIEGVKISSALKSRRWSTEMTQRDAVYLEKLGVSF